MGKLLGYLLLFCFGMWLVVELLDLLLDILLAIWPILFLAAILIPVGWICIKLFQKRQKKNAEHDSFVDSPALKTSNEQQPKKVLTTSMEKTEDLTITTNQQLQEFYDSHEFLKSFITKVVGVSYPNDDGSSRQEILSNCLPGEPVWLSWQSFNGAPACAVMSDYGQIGYLKADLAADLHDDYVARDVNNIIVFSSNISDITGGENGLYYGCNIMVSIYAPASPYSDEMFPIAVDVILEHGQASITQLQKRLHIGYSRASRLMDELEENGIVGPFRGSKPREVLITKEQWDLQKEGL